MIPEDTDLFDFGFDDVAVFQESGRVLGQTNAGWGSGEDDIAGVQGNALRQVADDGGDIKDHVAGGGFLAGLTIDAAADAEIQGKGQSAFVDNGRAEGAEGVQGFALIPLRMLFLEVSGGDVIGDCIAENIVFSVRFGDIRALLTNDDCQLGFIINLFGSVGVGQDYRIGAGNG